MDPLERQSDDHPPGAWRLAVLLAHVSYRRARRIVIAVVGFTVLAAGLAMVFLPGPAFVVIPIGVAILAVEFAWARRWLHQIRKTADGIRHHVKGRK
jgi:tellurite resistance protein TerC